MAEGPMTPPQHRHVPVAPGAPERPSRQDPENVNNKLQKLNLNKGGVARRLDFGNQNNN
jgi:hypothetical protein